MSHILTHIYKVFAEVEQECRRQDTKFPNQTHTPEQWAIIEGEEFGEVCRALNEYTFGNVSLSQYRKEMIECAAVAISAVLDFDRRQDEWLKEHNG